jgi:hypothetical protein
MKIKTGWYKVLINDLPAKQLWTCGDGCCQDRKDTTVWYPIGEIIRVEADCDDFEGGLGWETYQVGSDYEGYETRYYQPLEWIDYVARGYLEPTDPPKG